MSQARALVGIVLLALLAIAGVVACNNGDAGGLDGGFTLPDVDSDGVANELDNCPRVANADQADTDVPADGIGNVCDNCPTVSNPDQADSNGNGTGDLCEDLDGDGVRNELDNCPTAANANQQNSDGDALGDACDNCDTTSNADQADTDRNLAGALAPDGIGDACDICPTVPNPAQNPANGDGDSIPNECDNCPGVANQDQSDSDVPTKDGIGDTCDNCPLVTNANQADADGDGVGNVCDAEICNGVDDDGDTAVDETFPTKGAPCDGPDADSCQEGTLVCSGDGLSLVCNDATGDAVETCNGIDDDCDGTTDEGFGLGQACDSTDADLCTDDAITCDGAGGTTCTDVVNDKSELCNGLDDDCDGTTDEGFAIGGACDSTDADLCTDDVTACGPTGLLVCNDVVNDRTELCDGLDNDCDGTTDEGFDVDGDGSRTCDGDCNDNNAAVKPGATETCNGVDDDCDGQTDEGFNLGGACDSTDADTCTDDIIVCDGAGGTTCQDQAGAQTEICDGVDNDCDGQTDEGFNVGGACDSNDADLCTDDIIACSGGAAVCTDVVNDRTEVCDGADNDCDGKIDENATTGVEDTDADGLKDLCDKCPEDSSADNTDTDGDGFGDICDGTMTLTWTANFAGSTSLGAFQLALNRLDPRLTFTGASCTPNMAGDGSPCFSPNPTNWDCSVGAPSASVAALNSIGPCGGTVGVAGTAIQVCKFTYKFEGKRGDCSMVEVRQSATAPDTQFLTSAATPMEVFPNMTCAVTYP